MRGKGLDSQVPSTNTLNIITHLHNHHTIASGAKDLLLSGATRQGARRGGACNKEPGDLQPLPPSLKRSRAAPAENKCSDFLRIAPRRGWQGFKKDENVQKQ